MEIADGKISCSRCIALPTCRHRNTALPRHLLKKMKIEAGRIPVFSAFSALSAFCSSQFPIRAAKAPKSVVGHGIRYTFQHPN